MTEEDKLYLAQPLTDIYISMETDLMKAIAEQLAYDGEISPSSEWRLRKLAEAGALTKQAVKIIASYTGIQSEMLSEAVEIAALEVINELEPAFAKMAADGLVSGAPEVPASVTAKSIVSHYRRQAATDLNLVNTVMQYKAVSSYKYLVNKLYDETKRQEALNNMGKHTLSVVTGAESRQQAVRNCIREFSRNGIPAFVDKAGREWSPEAYVNMDIRTTVSNTAHAAQDAVCDRYDVDLIEISSHMGARPKCAPYQGKVYSRKGQSGVAYDGKGDAVPYSPLSETSYGQPDGIFGINCRHKKYPFVSGASFRTYFPYDEEENAERYRATQKQRYMERRVREASREAEMLKIAGDEQGAKEARLKAKNRRAEYRKYCSDNGLKERNDRLTVVKAKNGQSSGSAPVPDAPAVKSAPVKGAVPAVRNAQTSENNYPANTQTAKGTYLLKSNTGSSLKFGKVVGEKPISKQLAKEYSNEYSRIENLIGIKLNVTSIESFGYNNDDVWGGFNPNSGVLSLFGVGGDGGKHFITEVTKEMKKSGQWSTSSYLHSFRHELGHALQKELALNDVNYPNKLEKIKEIRNNLFKDLTGDLESDKLIKKRVLSIYGINEKTTEVDEFISECFAEYLNGKPRKTALEVINIILGKES